MAEENCILHFIHLTITINTMCLIKIINILAEFWELLCHDIKEDNSFHLCVFAQGPYNSLQALMMLILL